MFLIVLLAQALGCTFTRSYDLRFYVTSLIDDLVTSTTSFDPLVCDGRAAVYGVKTAATTSTASPKMRYIWDVASPTYVYKCTMSKSFFVPGRLTAATMDIFGDDLVLVKINNVQVTEISTTLICSMQSNKNVMPYIKLGLNTLYIEATNSLGSAYFGYRITIWTQLV